jgi:hypothetical protein
MKKPQITKKWSTIHVWLNDACINADFNHDTKKYYMSHGSNDSNVTFNSDPGTSESIQLHLDRAQCVITALNYIKTELKL